MFDTNEILPPLAFCVMAPLERMPVLPPPAVSLAVIEIFPTALVMVALPKFTTVAAVVLVPVMVTPLPAVRLPD